MAKTTRTILTCVACAAGCLAAGALSARIGPRDAWFDTLAKPTWMPPGWIFGVVWSVLYTLMGIAIGLATQPNLKPGGRTPAVIAFATQLVLNLAWSPIFFGLHSPGGAMIIILALWLAVGWAVAAMWSVNDLAGVLMLPYWAWVTFAVALNGAIWRMNAV